VEITRRLGVERQVELILPAEFEARAAERVIAALRAGQPLGQIGGMGRDLVGDDAGFHIVAVGQAKVLLGRDVAQHRAAEPADHRSADAAGDMVIARRNVGGERPQRVERRLMAALKLLVHVLLDLVHRHMARPLDHHLAIPAPGGFRELPKRLQLGKLRGVIGIGDRSGTQAVPQRKAHVVLAADIADFLEMLVEKALAVVVQAPFRHDRAAARDDPRHPLHRHRHHVQAHARVDGEVIHPLFRLLDQRVAEYLPCQILCDAIHLFQRLVDRHRADGDGAVADDPFAGVVDVAPGREVHHRIGPPADRPDQLFHLLFHRRGDGGGAHVGIHLHEEIAPDDHRLKLGMVDIGRDDGAARRDLGPHEFGRHMIGDVRAPVVAVARRYARLAQLVLADRHEFHLRRDVPGPRIGQLRGRNARRAAQGSRLHRKFRHQPVSRNKAVILRPHTAARIPLHIPARHDPLAAQGRQPLAHVDRGLRVGIGARTVIDRQRPLARRRMGGNLAHRHADVRVQ